MARDDTPTFPGRIVTNHAPAWLLTAGRWLAIQTAVLLLLFVQPVLAQESVVCGAEKLPGMIEGFFQLSIGLGLLGLVVVWHADSLMEMFTKNPEQKLAIKDHKHTALKSAVVLVVLGPLYTVAGSVMGLPLADCIDLAPW